MKIDLRRLYTYPVLAAERDDYCTCKFSATMNYFGDAAGNLVLNVDFRTDCAEILRLIAHGDAQYILHAECPPTLYREIFCSTAEKFSCTIPNERIKTHLDCMALIVLARDVKNFSCGDWNDDFAGLTFDLQRGNVLAYQNFQPMTLEDAANIFRNVASIFSVYRRTVDDAPFEIELAADKIKIGLSASDYVNYRRYCSRPDLQPILNAMIILPALVYVFEELKADADFETYGATAWFKSLTAAYRRRKINFTEHILREENTSIKLAQEVMNLPITRALNGVAHICDAAEDS